MIRAIIEDDRNYRVYLKKIDYQDALGLMKWSNFTDQEFSGYNYGDFTNNDVRYWYNSITAARKKYFAVRRKKDDLFIGFLGLKNINSILKRAKLGIVFDAAFVSKGYGYEAMQILLDYFFKELGYKELLLEVNNFNARAKALYKKLGFIECGEKLRLFENQMVDFQSEFFEYKNGMIYTKITKMKITEDDR